jgi:hypothetical protein
MIKELPQYPGYAISDDGRIRGRSGKWLSPSPNSGGYLHVTVFSPTGKQHSRTVHHLVGWAFHGEPQPGQQIRHLDGNKLNNAATNLRWGTGAQNQQDRILHGTAMAGERHPRATITDDDVRSMRRIYAAGGATQRELAAIYGFCDQQVYRIINRRAWKHVE